MSKISAMVVADSTNQQGDRITTMMITFPRFILAELNTHRMLSKNSASSRAIPFNQLLKSVQENGFKPIAWQLDHKGMQGSDYADEVLSEVLYAQWEDAKQQAIINAKALNVSNATKQLCNRLLEPFMWHTVLVTASEYSNFFELRSPCYEYVFNGTTYKGKSIHDICTQIAEDGTKHQDMSYDLEAQKISESTLLEKLQHNKGQAEIHMMALAESMWDARNESTPKQLKAGNWHIPMIEVIED